MPFKVMGSGIMPHRVLYDVYSPSHLADTRIAVFFTFMH